LLKKNEGQFRKPLLIFFVSEDWYFCSHRLDLAISALKSGYEVEVITRVNFHGDTIRGKSLSLYPIDFHRSGKNPLKESLFLLRLYQHFRRRKPDIVHNVALKPVLYGTIAARLANNPAIVNALGGMGSLFISRSWKARAVRPALLKILRFLLQRKSSKLILQNQDDVDLFVHHAGLDPLKVALIKGAGVNVSEFINLPETKSKPTVVLASRMLWDKGVGEFVEAAQMLRKNGINANFFLAGDPDPENPSSISRTQLEQWNSEGYVQWIGRMDNMSNFLSSVHIVCLPTYYGEGVPKILIEAASCGRAIVTTDWPGCRDIVRDNENGLLVPIKDPIALAHAIQKLIDDPELRHRMGKRGREIVEKEFSQEQVIRETLAVYEELLAECKKS
jgi:glycosyltransferase involved in cell wall biosynthesis